MNVFARIIKEAAIKNKYTKWYCNIIENALLRPQNREILKNTIGYVERHHILPKSFGLGAKNKENLVFLTAKEHFIVHVLLAKIFKNELKIKMEFALSQMKKSKKFPNRYFNSKLYHLLRSGFIEYHPMRGKHLSEETKQKISISLKGEKSPNFGKRLSDETREKISKAQLGKIISEETRRRMSKSGKGRKSPFLGQKHSLKTKQLLREKHLTQDNSRLQKPIKQINRITGEIIKTWPSTANAIKNLKFRSGGKISEVCNNKRKTAYGFKWEFLNN